MLSKEFMRIVFVKWFDITKFKSESLVKISNFHEALYS